jgi:hypothetical protein
MIRRAVGCLLFLGCILLVAAQESQEDTPKPQQSAQPAQPAAAEQGQEASLPVTEEPKLPD